MSTRRIFTKNITEDDQEFLFSDLSLTYSSAPTVAILSVQGDAIVNLHPDYPPTSTGFTIIVGSAGQVPSVASPIPFTFELISDEVEASSDTELITAAYIKSVFPEWETLCTRKDGVLTADEMLQIAIDMAEAEYQEFLGTIDPDDVTSGDIYHLTRIVKYNCHNFRHGDSEGKAKPQIVKDYEKTRTRLEKGLIRGDGVRLTSKDKKFDQWFTDEGTPWYLQS